VVRFGACSADEKVIGNDKTTSTTESEWLSKNGNSQSGPVVGEFSRVLGVEKGRWRLAKRNLQEQKFMQAAAEVRSLEE
jgi:hypothetical protein